MTGSELEIVGLAQNEGRFLDRSPRLGEATLVDRQLMTSGVDRFTQPFHAQIGEFFGDRLEALANVVEFSCHHHDDSCHR